jgi:proline iminopeptidase
VTSSFRTRDGVRIHFELRGSGPPILVCHGGPSQTYTQMARDLAPLEPRATLVYWDYRGSARSETAPHATYCYERLADDLDELRTHLGYQRVAVLGHSMGGFIALHFALQHPSRCERLILLSTTPTGRLWKMALPTAIALGPLRLAKLTGRAAWYTAWWMWRRESPPRTRARYAIMQAMQEPRRRFRAKIEAWARESFLENDNARSLERCWPRFDVTRQLGEIETPALVIYGTRDAAFVAGAWFLRVGLRRPRVVRLDGVGHLPFLEEPERTLAAIEDFVKLEAPAHELSGGRVTRTAGGR